MKGYGEMKVKYFGQEIVDNYQICDYSWYCHSKFGFINFKKIKSDEQITYKCFLEDNVNIDIDNLIIDDERVNVIDRWYDVTNNELHIYTDKKLSITKNLRRRDELIKLANIYNGEVICKIRNPIKYYIYKIKNFFNDIVGVFNK